MCVAYISKYMITQQMAKVLAPTYFMDTDIEHNLYDLQMHYLYDAKSTILTTQIESFCAEIHETYHMDLIECHETVCRRMGIAKNKQLNKILWSYIGNDYMVVSFSNPEIILAFNLDQPEQHIWPDDDEPYYPEKLRGNDVHDFEVYMLLEIDEEISDPSVFRRLILSDFHSFIAQFDDVSLEMYNETGLCMPPPEMRSRKHTIRNTELRNTL